MKAGEAKERKTAKALAAQQLQSQRRLIEVTTAIWEWDACLLNITLIRSGC